MKDISRRLDDVHQAANRVVVSSNFSVDELENQLQAAEVENLVSCFQSLIFLYVNQQNDLDFVVISEYQQLLLLCCNITIVIESNYLFKQYWPNLAHSLTSLLPISYRWDVR